MKPKLPFFRSTWNYDMHEASRQSGLECRDKTLTQQSFADEVDINTIVRRFNITGQLPTNVRMPTYADYDGVFDFHTAMNAIAQAHEAFDQMPAEVRARFHNDPAEFVQFCSTEENQEEALKLGLVLPKAAELAKGAPHQAKPADAPTAPTGAPGGTPAGTPPNPPNKEG